MDQPNVDPSRRRRIIERPRLLRLLDETEARIILLVAPAGYGKTTLARQWTGTGHRRGSTYRCFGLAADTASVAGGLAGRAAELVPGASARLHGRLRLSDLPTPNEQEMVEILVEDLSPWPSDGWLVIEDVHLLRPAGDLELPQQPAEAILFDDGVCRAEPLDHPFPHLLAIGRFTTHRAQVEDDFFTAVEV